MAVDECWSVMVHWLGIYMFPDIVLSGRHVTRGTWLRSPVPLLPVRPAFCIYTTYRGSCSLCPSGDTVAGRWIEYINEAATC